MRGFTDLDSQASGHGTQAPGQQQEQLLLISRVPAAAHNVLLVAANKETKWLHEASLPPAASCTLLQLTQAAGQVSMSSSSQLYSERQPARIIPSIWI